ncbi:MAG TPA: glycosyltransferase family 9 protein [Solirubrobacteraceae bacterium]|nr:glycosyltransferase family 9 protein [Solirubrobacteraceae bacterium]
MPVDGDLLAVTGAGVRRAGRDRVVILRALGLGDLLAGVPALRALAEGLGPPQRELLLVTPRALAPLVALIPGPARRRLRVAGADGLRSLPAAAAGAGLAVNLHGSGPQSHELLLRSGPGALLAFRHDAVPAAADGPAWDPGEHEAARWCRLVRHAGLDADPARLDLAPPRAAREHPLSGATVVHPGAASVARRWPAERFAAIAQAEAATGRSVVVTGGPGELPLARRVAAAAGLPAAAVLAGRTSVAELAALVAAAGRVVCGDTGVAHLATAFGTPSVVLFGPTPPASWGPPPARRHRHRVVWSGRSGDPHGEATDPGLLAIGTERVLRELQTLELGA